jgi:hypothetical protein
MKRIIMFSLLAFSGFVQAHVCHLGLYNPSILPIQHFYTQNDNQCVQASTQCVTAIRNLRLNPNHYKCYTIAMSEDPTPVVVPAPNPVPVPDVKSDAKRAIQLGETVIFNNDLWVVTALPSPGFLNLIPEAKRKESKIVENVNRTNVAITRGCHAGLCTRESVIDIRTRRTTAIIGIEYNGNFVVQQDEDLPMSDVPASDLQKNE